MCIPWTSAVLSTESGQHIKANVREEHGAFSRWRTCFLLFTIKGKFQGPPIVGPLFPNYTPSKFNSLPLKIDDWKTSFLLECLFLGAMLNLWGVYSHTTSIPEFLEAHEKSGMLMEGCPTIQGPPEKSLMTRKTAKRFLFWSSPLPSSPPLPSYHVVDVIIIIIANIIYNNHRN